MTPTPPTIPLLLKRIRIIFESEKNLEDMAKLAVTANKMGYYVLFGFPEVDLLPESSGSVKPKKVFGFKQKKKLKELSIEEKRAKWREYKKNEKGKIKKIVPKKTIVSKQNNINLDGKTEEEIVKMIEIHEGIYERLRKKNPALANQIEKEVQAKNRFENVKVGR